MKTMIIKLGTAVIGQKTLSPEEVRKYQNAGFVCVPSKQKFDTLGVLCYNNDIIKRQVVLMNKIMSILSRGLTEEEIMERLDSHNVKYV